VDGSEDYLPAKCDDIEVSAGDILYFNTWGGGGWGDPFLREPKLVQQDAIRELVSQQGARRYGVVLNDDLSIDEPATVQLRKQLSEERGEVDLFDFGGSIEEIKQRCLQETHLAAPETPRFQRARA
jgi:N-methylhydantoinase B